MKKVLCFFLFVLISIACSAENLSPDIVKKVKPGVVSVTNSPQKSAYERVYSHFASGFLINKAKGIIVTNAHVASYGSINDLRLTFFNGKEIDAQFIYNDPTHDFAFLQVDPAKIPHDVLELKLSKEEAKTGQSVFIIGNNEGKNFSLQTGVISNKYQTMGFFPAQTYSISLNTRGGSSGSPVLNYSGEVVGLHFAGSDTSASALNIKYVTDALVYILQNKIPTRLGFGANVNYDFLDKAVKYRNFPEQLVADYIRKYPDALNRALAVYEVFQDSPAFGVLMPGDIIWQVNGQDVGPNLYVLDNAINKAASDLALTIYREGVKQIVQVKSYNLHTNTVKRMVIFGGAIFYESDEYIRRFTGAKLGSVFVTNSDDGSIFHSLPKIYGLERSYSYFSGMSMVNILGFNDIKIANLDDLIKAIPSLVKRKNFTAQYVNFFFTTGYNSFPYESRNQDFAEVEYKSYGDEPVELIFNDASHTWDVKKIELQ